jgi:hypothetical protein
MKKNLNIVLTDSRIVTIQKRSENSHINFEETGDNSHSLKENKLGNVIVDITSLVQITNHGLKPRFTDRRFRSFRQQPTQDCGVDCRPDVKKVTTGKKKSQTSAVDVIQIVFEKLYL